MRRQHKQDKNVQQDTISRGNKPNKTDSDGYKHHMNQNLNEVQAFSELFF